MFFLPPPLIALFRDFDFRTILMDAEKEDLLATCLRIITRSITLFIPEEEDEDPVKDKRGVPMFVVIQNRLNALGVVPVVVSIINMGVHTLVKEALQLALALLQGPNLQVQVMHVSPSVPCSVNILWICPVCVGCCADGAMHVPPPSHRPHSWNSSETLEMKPFLWKFGAACAEVWMKSRRGGEDTRSRPTVKGEREPEGSVDTNLRGFLAMSSLTGAFTVMLASTVKP